MVIAPKLDRLFRSALDALKVVDDLRRRGVSLCLLDLGGDISGNGLSKLFLTIAAAFAEAERDRIKERVSQSKADQEARGRYLGGTVPFGYRRGESGELVPHEGEQEAIRFATFAPGTIFGELAILDEGVRSATHMALPVFDALGMPVFSARSLALDGVKCRFFGVSGR